MLLPGVPCVLHAQDVHMKLLRYVAACVCSCVCMSSAGAESCDRPRTTCHYVKRLLLCSQGNRVGGTLTPSCMGFGFQLRSVCMHCGLSAL